MESRLHSINIYKTMWDFCDGDSSHVLVFVFFNINKAKRFCDFFKKNSLEVVHRLEIKNNFNQILRKALKHNLDGERNILYQVTSKSSKLEAKRPFRSLYHCPLAGSTIHIANTCFLIAKSDSSILVIPFPNIKNWFSWWLKILQQISNTIVIIKKI